MIKGFQLLHKHKVPLIVQLESNKSFENIL